MISFKDWLRKDEVATMSGGGGGGGGGGGTFTGDIAKFAQPIGGMVTRMYPSMDEPKKKKKHKHKHNKKPKVLEMFPGKKVVMGDIGYF